MSAREKLANYDRALGTRHDGVGGQRNLTRAEICFKYTLMVANTIFLIFSLVLIGVGAAAKVTPIGSISGYTLPIGLIVIGVFIMLLSFLGCCGAWRENQVVLAVYSVLLFIMIIALLGTGIAIYIRRDDADNMITQTWTATDDGARGTLQSTWNCCGLRTFNDSLATQPCPASSLANPQGCLAPLREAFQNQLTTAGGVGIAFSVLMLIGLIFTCFLMRGVRQSKYAFDGSSATKV